MADVNGNREKDLTKTRWCWTRILPWSLFRKTTGFPFDGHSGSQLGGVAGHLAISEALIVVVTTGEKV